MTPTLDISTLTVRSTPEPARLEQEALTWPQRASAIAISDQPSYDGAVQLLRAAKDLRKEAEEHHRPVIDAAHKAHKAALAALQRIDDPLAAAERTIKTKIILFEHEQEQIRVEAQRKANEEAERKAAEQFERELEAIEAAGAKPAEIAAIIREAEQVPVITPLAAPTYRRAAGIPARVVWAATVTNPVELIQWVAKNTQYSSLLKVDQTALNQLARSLQSNLKIPGVRVQQGTTIAVR